MTGIVIAVIIGIFILGVVSMWKIGKQAQSFYEEADVLENEIKTQNEFEIQYDKMIKLNDKAFHRNLSNRVRELGKMLEVKYNKSIL